MTPRTDPAHGQAAYDGAATLFYEGAYQSAADAFGDLLRPKTASSGYDPRGVSLWRRHAAACAGYHEANSKRGIPEPPRLDPECGIASLAACLRALGRPYDRKTLRAACRVTGEGSSLADLVASGKKLGVSIRAVSADDKGLMALPKPLVAFAERDHFIAVVRADKAGVSYLCSDCGMWPGGRVNLTWKQWRALSPGVYAVVTIPGTVKDRAVAAVTTGGRAAPVRLSYGGALSALRLSSRLQVLTAAVPMRDHVFRFGNTYWLGCGYGIGSLHCCPQPCPVDGPGSGPGGSPPGGSPPRVQMSAGPSAGDPVNLATGEEEYTPAPDLTVYNPTGPAVTWGRLYNSLRPGSFTSYEQEDFGGGWSQPYNIFVQGPGTTGQVRQIPQVSGAGPYQPTGGDAPANGRAWDVLLNGTTVASSAAPNAWVVTVSDYTVAVVPPASAAVATGYEVRWIDSDGSNPAQPCSYPFDVIPAASVLQGGSACFAADGQDAPASGLDWDVVQGGVTVASSASPNGWSVGGDNYDGPSALYITAPPTAPVGNYEARVVCDDDYYDDDQGGTTTASASFSVYATHLLYAAGPGSLYEPNGAVVSFTAPQVPDAAHPAVVCSVAPGYPYFIEWDYVPGYPSGRFVVTGQDRSRWVTTPAVNRGYGNYLLSQVIDRNGNAISLQYGAASFSASFLLLTGITDSAGTPLLTISRGVNNIIMSVSDRYGRSVYYAPNGNQLGQVSQVVPTGTANALTQYNRYTYGYVGVYNYEGEGGFALLHTIQTPTGGGTSTATINYANGTFAVTSIVDGSGNTRTYTPVYADGTPAEADPYTDDTDYTQVSVTNSAGLTAYSYMVSFDGNMSETGRTDGATDSQGRYTHQVSQKTYADPNNPYRPDTVTDGNDNVSRMTWDQYGNLHQTTSPRGTVTNFVYGFPPATYGGVQDVPETQPKADAFALGELLSMQEGAKAPTSYAYYEPSGLLHTLTTPAPGTAGSTATVTTSWAYDGLGNVLTETMPGNNATVVNGADQGITTTFGYTQDGGYSQSAAMGQPLTSTDNLGKVTHFRYDSRGNRLSVTDALGNEYDFTYNPADQPLTTTDPATGQSGPGHASQVMTYLYVGGPMTTALAYDEGNTSGPIRQVNYSYGPEGETLGTSGSTEPVTYAYDALYRLSALTDGGGHTTHYYYKAQGYLDAVTYPGYAGPAPAYNAATDDYDNVTGNDSRRFPSYDANGNVLTRIDGNSVMTTYSHSADPESLLTLIHYAYPSGYAGTQITDVSLSYDGYGRRSGMADGTGSQSYAYDDRGGLLSDTTTYTGLPSQAITYEYWRGGSRRSMSTPAGGFSYAYDAAGRLNALTNPDGEVTNWQYQDNGWLHTRGQANGAVTTYAYNARGLITDLLTTTGAGTTLSDFGSQTYDSVGNRTALTAALPDEATPYNGTTAYGYDSGQATIPTHSRSLLTDERSTRGGGYTEANVYDSGAGTGPANPTTLRGFGHTFNADNQDTANTYDGDGSPTTYQGQGLSFDPEARMAGDGGRAQLERPGGSPPPAPLCPAATPATACERGRRSRNAAAAYPVRAGAGLLPSALLSLAGELRG